jgi:branched-chain amino acid transport system permease protein
VFDVRRFVPLLAVIAIALAVALVGSAGSESFQRTVTTVLITLVVVVGLYVFTGTSGILSFGHVAFMALGAYTAALVRIPPGLKGVTLPHLPGFIADASAGPVLAVFLGAAVAGLFAVLIAAPLVRLSGIAAAIASLSVLVIVNVVISNWDNLTNGTQTMVGVPATATIWSVVPWVLGVLLLAFCFQESASGARLKATREDAVAAQAVGVHVAAERSKAFVLSAMCAGVGGALYAEFLGAFGPGQFYLDLTFLTIAMLVIGGLRSLAGAVIGTVAVSAVSELLQRIQSDGLTIAGATLHTKQGLREVILAALMLLALLVRPQGLTGGREVRWPRRRETHGG